MGKTIIVTYAVCMTLLVQFAGSLECPPGTYLYTIVHSGQEFCIECPDGTYMAASDHRWTSCRPCETIREPELEILVSPCNKTHDAVIHCLNNYYRDLARNPRETGQCKKCTQCEFPGQACSTYRNTVCCLDENFDVVPNHHGVPVCRERPWFCRRGQYFETSGHYCLPCPDNTFMPLDYHIQTKCLECRDLEADRPLHSVVIQPCNSTHAPVIRCEDGFFRDPEMSYRNDAIGCSPCTDCSTKTNVQYDGQRCVSLKDTVCCPHANMTVHDTPDGPVCMALSAYSCDEGNCLLYHTKNGSSTCVPCLDNTNVDQPGSNYQDSALLSEDTKPAIVSPQKAEDKRDTYIATACSDVRFTFWQFPLGLISGQIIDIIFIIMVFRSKYLRKYFLGTWIGSKVRSFTERYIIGLPKDAREARELQPLNIPLVEFTPQERWSERTPRTDSMSDYGELEQSFGNELDLQAQTETCRRLSDHVNLLGEGDFVIENLPPDFRDQRYLDYIKATSNLTVRLRVHHVSEDRPENDPYYDLRGLAGNGLRRFGSGLVYQVSKRFDEDNNKKCPCKDCQVFPEIAKTNWSEFLVLTSAQIVFDETECSQTSCKLWNDKDENPGEIPSLKGWEVKDTDRDKDVCILRCVSHDPNVIKELQERVDNFNRLHAQNKQAPNDTADVNKLAVLIAHPHGLSKRIFLRNANAERGQAGKWTYDDYTCPGSVGAPVCLLSNKKDSKILITIYNGNRESRGFEMDIGMPATALDLDDTFVFVPSYRVN